MHNLHWVLKGWYLGIPADGREDGGDDTKQFKI